MTTFWRRTVHDPDAFPPEFWQFFLQSSLTAGALRQWRPRLEEVN